MTDVPRDQRLLAMHRSRSHANCYELTGTRTASVRDQMVRAVELTAALCRSPGGLLATGRPLLVIGGGAAGVSAAMTAVAAGVACVLVEREVHPAASDEPHLFKRQWDVTTRRLDPTEFDWPQPHWNQPHWPPAEDGYDQLLPLPLPYEADTAAALASRWDRTLHQFRRRLKAAADQGRPIAAELHVVPPLDAGELDIRFGAAGIAAGNRRHALPYASYGALLSCVGQGAERVWSDDASRFRSARFWASDPLCDRALGTDRRPGLPIHALVSGGGDGAMQDIQRILCGDFGRGLMQRHGAQLGNEIAARLDMGPLHEGDAALRAALNSRDQAQIEAARLHWDQTFAAAAADFWNKLLRGRRNVLTQTLLRAEVRDSPLHLSWLLEGQRPTACYGLNRFLTELVLHAYAAATGRALRDDTSAPGGPARQPVVLTGHRIHKLASAARVHACDPNAIAADACTAHPHQVAVLASGGAADPDNAIDLGLYHIVVLRHGLIPAQRFGGAAEPDQLMPLDWL